MTKKDFELIAGVLRDFDFAEGISPETTRLLLAEDFAAKLATTNERFDAERFIKASV